jgi:hypothetical protein
MDRFNALGRGAQVMLVGAVLLLIDLFLPWQDFDVLDVLGVDATFSGWRGIGAVLGILTIVLIAWLAIRIAGVAFPLPVSTTVVSAALGALILVFGVIKWLTIIDDEATVWAWIGLGLSIVVAVGAWMVVQAGGGMEALRSELPSMPAAAAPAPAPSPPAAAAEPPAPAEAGPQAEPEAAPAPEGPEPEGEAPSGSEEPGEQQT